MLASTQRIINHHSFANQCCARLRIRWCLKETGWLSSSERMAKRSNSGVWMRGSVIYYPKFHRELNFIELKVLILGLSMIWRIIFERYPILDNPICNFKFSELKKNIDELVKLCVGYNQEFRYSLWPTRLWNRIKYSI